METRTVKNVCAPAAVIDDKIYIVGGKKNLVVKSQKMNALVLTRFCIFFQQDIQDEW